MLGPANSNLRGDSGSQRAKRAHNRRPQSKLTCNFGPILDLSAGGMRVIAKKPLAGVVVVHLQGPGIDQDLKATVAWAKKISFRTYEIGFKFIHPPATRAVMEWIAIWSAHRPTA